MKTFGKKESTRRIKKLEVEVGKLKGRMNKADTEPPLPEGLVGATFVLSDEELKSLRDGEVIVTQGYQVKYVGDQA